MSVWLAAMAAWYVWTAADAVRHPLNAGSDRQWAIAWLAYAAAALAWHGVWRRPVAAALWRAGLAAAGAAMIVASGRLVPALAGLWLVALAACLGARLLRFFGAAPSGVAFEWLSVAVPAGLALLALAALGFGLARLLAPGWILALFAALTLLEARCLWRTARRLPEVLARTKLSLEESVLTAFCGFAALVNLAWALAPEIQYDALNYHLAVPAAYLAEHRVLDLPHFWHSYFAQMMEVLFALGLALGGQAAVKLLTFAMGIAAALAVYALGRALFNARVGLWTAALFYATPMTAWLSGTAYTDLAAGFFLLSSLIAFLRWRRARENGWLWASGWLAGASLGVKATAAYGLPVIGAMILWDLARGFGGRQGPPPGFPEQRGSSGLARIRSLAGFLGAAALSALPWYLLRFSFTGNPFFPLGTRLFHGASAVPAGFDPGGIVGEGFGRQGPLRALFELPFLATFGTNRFGEPFSAGALGAALVVLFPLGVFLLLRRRGKAAVPLVACAVSLVLWELTFRGVRHYFVILPLAVTLAVATVDALSPAGWRRRFHFTLLGVVLLAQSSMISVQFWNIPDRIPVRLAFGRESPEHFLSRALPAYSAVQYVNRFTRPEEKVLGVAVANARFYFRARLDTVGENWELQAAVARPRGEELAAALSAMGYRYLVISGVRPGAHAGYPFLEPSFLARFATLEFSRNGSDVYRLRAAP
jgi:hypothetical protein